MAMIQMSANEVIDRCVLVLAAIKAEREKRDEDAITAEMAKTYFCWGLFCRLNYTREQAIANCKSKDWGWFFPSYHAGEQKQHVEKLLILARRGDPVTLNETDCYWLFD